MGASYQYFKAIHCSDEYSLKQKFYAAVERAEWEHGHSGYTGTFAEKSNVKFQPGVWSEEDAYEHCINYNNKQDPAFAYRLTDGDYYVGGWCAS